MPTQRIYDAAGHQAEAAPPEPEPSASTPGVEFSDPDPLLTATVAAAAFERGKEQQERLRLVLAEAMKRAREGHTLREVAKATGYSIEWVRRLTAE